MSFFRRGGLELTFKSKIIIVTSSAASGRFIRAGSREADKRNNKKRGVEIFSASFFIATDLND